MADSSVRVEGIPEAQAAFRGVSRDFENEQAQLAEDAANTLIPDIEHLTRRDTGAMAGGWGVDTDKASAFFVNSQEYWTFQEFGTEDVEPTLAILHSWERNEKDVVAAYDKGMKQIAKDNGFEQ